MNNAYDTKTIFVNCSIKNSTNAIVYERHHNMGEKYKYGNKVIAQVD